MHLYVVLICGITTYSEKIYTYAYGDGLNDLAMFASVDVGIAMRNGAKALKEVAHEVIGIAEEDALYHSFIKQGFI